MGGFIGYFLIIIFVFGILIFIHEWGHFITARACGVTVKEFAIGMGPRILSWTSKKHNTKYALRLFPIGGFVSMENEDGTDETVSPDDPGAFSNKSVPQRMLITVAGAVMNLLLGFVLMMIIVFSTQNLGSTVIAKFADNATSAEKLMVEDEIIKVGNTRVHTWNELAYEIMNSGYEPVDITVVRNGETVVLHDVVFPRASEQGQVFGLMDFKVRQIEKDFGNFMTLSFRKTALVFRMCWESIFDLITGRYTVAAVSGPIGISSAIGDAVSSGFLTVLNLVVIISINLGFMNLLPIPALDGGRMLVLLVEMVSRKKLPQKVEMTINAVGLAVLLGLSLIIMVKDVFTLF